MTLKRRERALFLDRDGTLTKMELGKYINHWRDLEMIEGVAKSLLPFQEAGWKLIVVSNQQGVALGHFDHIMLNLMHARLTELFASEGVFLTRVYTCTHSKEANCKCRKPRPGLIARAAIDYGISCRRSWMVGDFRSDVAAGNAVGCKTALIDQLPEYNSSNRFDNDSPTIWTADSATTFELIADIEGIL